MSADGARVSELEATVDGLERELARSRTHERETAAIARANESELRRVRRELDSLRRRRSVRLATWGLSRLRATRNTVRALAGRPRRAIRRVRRRVDERIRQRGLRASPAAEAALVAALRANLSPATVRGGRLISIVILNRDGRQHLERCLRALAATTYRDIEVIVVDNGSTDGSAEVAERFDGWFPLRVVRNAVNRSFAEANDQGVSAAEGELICFLNNDADPITGEWLGYLAETLDRNDAVAVGARLIYPVHRGGRRAGRKHADLTLQHGGVDFIRELPIPMPRAMGAGGDPLSAAAVEVAERPALTGACLLVRRDAFLAVGGFAREYDYGLEDVDLCLRLRAAGGRLMYDGRAALWHHESATRAGDQSGYQARVARNRDVFVDRWGPRLFRDCLLGALDGNRRWSDAPFHVAITLTSLDPDAGYGDWYTGHELGDALAALGWQVSYLARKDDGWYHPDRSVEAVIALIDTCDVRRLPRRLVSMAWIRNWPERWLERAWFDEFDIVFGSSDRIVAMVRERSAKTATLLPIATNPDRFGAPAADPEQSCDVLFTGNYWGQWRDVVDALPALAERGISVRVHGRGWHDVSAMAALDRGFLVYDDIPSAYAAARIVVDDAAISTKDCGSVNSRVFDALAAGAVVVTNGEVGVHDLFDASFPTWSDASSLVDLVEGILRDPTPAEDRARTLRTLVLAHHTYAIRAQTVRDTLVAWVSASRYGLRIGMPEWQEAEGSADDHFARALQRALERGGHPTRLHFLGDWEQPVSAREDVAVYLFGPKEAHTRSGQVNLLWQISQQGANPAMYERYDHVFVASDPVAARTAAGADVAVTPLDLATDPELERHMFDVRAQALSEVADRIAAERQIQSSPPDRARQANA